MTDSEVRIEASNLKRTFKGRVAVDGHDVELWSTLVELQNLTASKFAHRWIGTVTCKS